MREKNKKSIVKKLILTISIFILLIILTTLLRNTYNTFLNQKKFENNVIAFSNKNQNKIFSINRIIFFSSSDSKNKTSSISNFTIENLYAYTDVALFINNNSEINNTKNTLKNLKIYNIKISKKPEIGDCNLYFKSINNFAKSEINEDNLINDELKFDITSENKADLNKAILFNNCANPITLSYINQNIKNDYTMTDIQNPITYNGKLLKRCGVLLDKIDASISFDIEIENNDNEKFKTTVYFDIPYEENDKSIYDGNFKVEKNVKFDFYRFE